MVAELLYNVGSPSPFHEHERSYFDENFNVFAVINLWEIL